MSATVDNKKIVHWGDRQESEIQLSSLVAGSLETIAHGGPGGAVPDHCYISSIVTQSYSREPITLTFEGYSTTNDTVDVRFTVPPGCSITGAVLKFRVAFKEVASGGIS